MAAKNALAEISKSRVDKAGKRLREHAEGDLELEADDFAVERDLARQFRLAHGRLLELVAANLRYYVREQSELMIIGKRLKRIPTIVDKLTRHPEMALSRMHDIGGCRAVLRNEEEVRAICSRLEGNWRLAHEPYDYISAPKQDERPFLGLKTGRALALLREYYARGADLLEKEDKGEVIKQTELTEFRVLNQRIFDHDDEKGGA